MDIKTIRVTDGCLLTTVDTTTEKAAANANANANAKANAKAKKLRVETSTWQVTEEQLSHEAQLDCLQHNNNTNDAASFFEKKLTSHLKAKLYGYMQQDICKHKYNKDMFVSLEETKQLLVDCNLTCCYCSEEVYVLYKCVRENKQWTLDRIDNEKGHNRGNLVIACLECNLKRRRTNKDAFQFTKQMVLTKLP